jgi:hypothetical protein
VLPKKPPSLALATLRISGSNERINSKAARFVTFAAAISTVKVSPLRTFWLLGNMLTVAPWAARVPFADHTPTAVTSNPTVNNQMGQRTLNQHFIVPIVSFAGAAVYRKTLSNG